MPTLANVAITDTFDTWRIRTNQIIVSLNSVDSNSTNALSVSNSAAITANVAYDKGNSAATTANSSYNQSNTAYTQANTGYTQANTGYTQANTAYTVANNAYGKANAANSLAYTSGIVASASFDQANTGYAQSNLVFGFTNTAFNQANTAYSQANLVYAQANTGYTQANLVFGFTNTAYNKANSANYYASLVDANVNAAFVKANNALANTSGVVFNGILYITQNVGIGITSAPAANLHVKGDIIATGDITSAYSDERLKDVIEPIQNAIIKISTLDTFYYRPNQTALDLGLQDEIQVGVSAQQVLNIAPEVVKNAPIGQGYLTVQYERLVPLLIESIKELTQRIEKLENGTKNRKCNCSKRQT